MHSIINTLLNEHLLPFWVLLSIIVVERYVPWPDKYHPISFIKVLAIGMQAKVLSPERNSIRQQEISGTLACIVLLLPFVAYWRCLNTYLSILFFLSINASCCFTLSKYS